MKYAILPISLGSLSLAGCGLLGPDEAEYAQRLATIEHYQEKTVVELPDTVGVGRQFLISVRTFGGGCIRKGDTEVTMRDAALAEVEFRPFDYEAVRLPPNTVCTADLRYHDHTALVTINRPGPAVVRIIGRSKPSGEQITVTKQVTVVADTLSRVNAVTMVGKITDPDGQPVRATVRVAVLGNCPPFASRDTVTNAAGEYRKTLLAQRSCTQTEVHLFVDPITNTLLSGGSVLGDVRLAPIEATPVVVRRNIELRKYP
jgi:hypothetical protein